MTVPTYAIYGVSYPDSNSAGQFFECVGMSLIVHYYVKKKAKLVPLYTNYHKHLTHIHNVFGKFSSVEIFHCLPCSEEQSSTLPLQQHCHCVRHFITNTDYYLAGKIDSLFHNIGMQCTMFSFFEI